jgi:signal transduction histidine kinase
MSDNTPHRIPSEGHNIGGRQPHATLSATYLAQTERIVHELTGLLDGSLRCLELARKALSGSDLWTADPQAEEVNLHLHRAAESLERISDLVHISMQGPAVPMGSASRTDAAGATAVSIADAVAHAVAVAQPHADEAGIRISTHLQPNAAALPVGPLYPVILNGLRNAVEAVARCGPGAVDIHAALSPPLGRNRERALCVRIEDDGYGPHEAGNNPAAFEPGYTTKERGSGLGLALCRSVVENAGGLITLARRTDRTDRSRPGAILLIIIPLDQDETGADAA